MGAVATFVLSLPLFVDAADEGRKIITAMLLVGLVFIGVLALGETSRWLRHRRRPGH